VVETLLFLCSLVTGRSSFAQASDRELVARTARGESAALEILHKRYYAKLYKLALVKVGNEDDAHDIASEAFVRAVQHVFRLDPLSSASLYPWLHTVVQNLAVDHYRRTGHVETVSEAAECEEMLSLFERMEDPAPLPEEVVARKQVQAAVRQALASLPEIQAKAVFFRFVGEMSLAEIGAELGKSEGAVKSLLHRGMINLRARCQEIAEERRRRRQGETGRDVHGDTLTVRR
jgi:RNA polymerase sigma-70 factor, ECF subfamily